MAKDKNINNELFSPEEMQSPFDSIKEVDAEGHEWWNSRKLARLLGYMKYWNFERLMDKVAKFLQQEKGLDLKEHMVEIEEMVQLNNGGYRQVTSFLLSRTACVAIAMNADKKKPITKVAQDYFTQKMDSKELATSFEGNVLIYRTSTGKVNVSVLFNNDTFSSVLPVYLTEGKTVYKSPWLRCEWEKVQVQAKIIIIWENDIGTDKLNSWSRNINIITDP